MFWMEKNRPQQYKARLAEKYYLNEGERFMYLHFELVDPSSIQFYAGQYLNIKVADDQRRRAFSLVSTPDVHHGVSIVAEILPDGKASAMFANMQPGVEVEILAPLGKFMVNEVNPGEKLLFVATGSGIAPLYSMINDQLRNKGDTRPIRLHWGLRKEEDIFWLDNLMRLQSEYDNFVFDLVLSKPLDGWELCWGHVQDCIRRDLSDLVGWEAYVSGNKPMIEETRELLLSRGLKEDQFYREQFY